MTMYNAKEKQRMKEVIKNNPIIYVCDDCGKEFKDRVPFPEGCECGNACEDYFTEKHIEKKRIPHFNRFDSIKMLHKAGVHTYKELINKKNKELKELIKANLEKIDV